MSSIPLYNESTEYAIAFAVQSYLRANTVLQQDYKNWLIGVPGLVPEEGHPVIMNWAAQTSMVPRGITKTTGLAAERTYRVNTLFTFFSNGNPLEDQARKIYYRAQIESVHLAQLASAYGLSGVEFIDGELSSGEDIMISEWPGQQGQMMLWISKHSFILTKLT